MPESISSPANFILRWQRSGSAERANYSMFLTELCTLLDVPGPQPTQPDDRDNAYVFERSVPMDDGDGNTTVGRIDLYKRGCFVLEAKQGSASEDGPTLFAPDTPARLRRGTAIRGTAHWDAAMKKAKGQAERYVRSLPADEGNPPFIVVVDVGHVIELYADFSRLGKTYTPFPDIQSYRIPLDGLADEKVRERLATLWTEPLTLDPARHSAKVTREIAEKLAKLAKSFEAAGYNAENVANFLMRCLFTFFAEDVGLIDLVRAKEQPFTDLLKSMRGHLDQFIPLVQDVWSRMDSGGFSPAMRRKLKHFNGGLFAESHALPVTADQLELLIQAGESDWSDVEPAIFGTLLERALEPRERHKLGAHYTPRAYVERLVLPTVIEPLREKWDAAKAAAFTLQFQGKNDEARKAVHEFLAELCSTIVLDPACGSANFLYVTMEHMKRLEGEAREELRQLGETQVLLERGGLTVDPHQFLGLELNPRAVAIAELVLWIGYLKWHLRTLGHAPSEPLLKAFHNIKQQDAVLAYDRKEIVTDDSGKPVSRWDGHTIKVSPVTGEKVPDDAARVPVYRYVNPRKAEWPKADYVVGNPPFIGNKLMFGTLTEDYSVALRSAHDVPESCDYVMYWWNYAAELVRADAVKRFGFITTNSITQSFNRRILARQLEASKPLSLTFAVPDHPWTETGEGAAVRIAMTVGVNGAHDGRLIKIVREHVDEFGESDVITEETTGKIHADLSCGPNIAGATPLLSNTGICGQGMKLVGDFFVETGFPIGNVSPVTGLPVIRSMITPNDVLEGTEGRLVIDFFNLNSGQARAANPAAYQRLVDLVKPLRDQNRRGSIKQLWWRFAWERPVIRRAIGGLEQYLVTLETSKYRVFSTVPSDALWDGSLFGVALDDNFFAGILGSHAHSAWALKAGGLLGPTPRYNRTSCFEAFPFPACAESQKSRIRSLGESLDAHRKRQQSLHPGLTITDMYNVLEKLRKMSGNSSVPPVSSPAEGSRLDKTAGGGTGGTSTAEAMARHKTAGGGTGGTSATPLKSEPFSAKDRMIHEQGLVSVLKQIHDDLDAAVAEAYGWPVDLADEEILRRLVALNAERAEEERRGVIRWLRPEFQNPTGASANQGTLGLPSAQTVGKAKKVGKLPWPKSLAEQAHAVRVALGMATKPVTAADLSRQFKSAKVDRIGELLATLAALGQARSVGGNRFVV